MRFPLFPSPIRVIDSSGERPAVIDDGPPPVPGGRPKGSKRLHTNATVATVRRLIEQTTLTYQQIAAKTGVRHGTVGRWARDGGWQRHPFAPRACDTVPTARAGRRLKLRMLGTKLHLLAERCVEELWQNPSVDLDRLIEAMQVLKMARLYVKGRGRPGKPGPTPRTGQDWIDRDTAIRTALKEMRRGGVNRDRIPAEAMALLEDAYTPPDWNHPALRPPGPKRGPRRRK
jgi:ribosomal protein L19E